MRFHRTRFGEGWMSATGGRASESALCEHVAADCRVAVASGVPKLGWQTNPSRREARNGAVSEISAATSAQVRVPKQIPENELF
jgi:hypothetical protein